MAYMTAQLGSLRFRPSSSNQDESAPSVAVIGHDRVTLGFLVAALGPHGCLINEFVDAEQYLLSPPVRVDCIVVDCGLSNRVNCDLPRRLRAAGRHEPSVVVGRALSASLAADAVAAGAVAVLDIPCDECDLLRVIATAIDRGESQSAVRKWRNSLVKRLAALSDEERQVMEMMVSDLPNKTIAARLDISLRTVDRLRRAVLDKMGAESLPQLAMFVAELVEEARSRC